MRSARSISIGAYSPFTNFISGKENFPISSFFAKMAKPSRSNQKILMKSPLRLLKMKRLPESGSCCKRFCTMPNSPLKDLRISAGFVQAKIRVEGERLNTIYFSKRLLIPKSVYYFHEDID